MRQARGFTLLEVLIATMILGGGIMVMANAWSGNFMRVRNARINNTMASLLEKKMTEVEVLSQEKSVNDIAEEDTGDFGAKFPGYRWEQKSKPFEMPDLSSALTAKDGGVDQMTLTIVHTMSDYIKQAVKEVNITVFYKGRRGKEIKQGATIYAIDYSKELPLQGLGGMGGAMGGSGASGGSGGGAAAAPSTGAGGLGH